MPGQTVSLCFSEWYREAVIAWSISLAFASCWQDVEEGKGKLFEWQDGPLVTSMTSGGVLLIDEISLADDSVLERLNSVLEPSRYYFYVTVNIVIIACQQCCSSTDTPTHSLANALACTARVGIPLKLYFFLQLSISHIYSVTTVDN